MIDLIEHFQLAVQNLPVSHVWRGHGSALFLELGEVNVSVGTRRDGTPKEPFGEIGVMIEWSWRVERGSSILCGSWSDEALWQPAFDLLKAGRVDSLSTFGRLPEISLSLSNDVHIASFMTAEGDPTWALFDRRHQKPITIHSRSGSITREVRTSTKRRTYLPQSRA
jgi:hypothetical protein